MQVSQYLEKLCSHYTLAPSRVRRYLNATITDNAVIVPNGVVFELKRPRGGKSVMQVQEMSDQTTRRRGGRFRVRFFDNDLDSAKSYYWSTTDRMSVCYHEAGHAVAALGLGIHVESVMVGRNFRNWTWGAVSGVVDPGSIDGLVSALAGPMAEGYFNNRKSSPGWAADLCRVRAEKSNELISEAKRKAGELLRQYQNALHGFALHLYYLNEIKGDSVREYFQLYQEVAA